MIRILSVLGTRPEAIKMAPVVDAFRKYPRYVMNRVCVTAQHREMLDEVLALFSIKPDYDLNLMRERQSLSGLTSAVLTGLHPILRAEEPGLVLVQGDTTTAMAAALAAYHDGIKVAHVEAGLRTYNKSEPFPEEANRRIISSIADLHFVPTASARENLLRENVPPNSIVMTGNTVIDALKTVSALPRNGDCDLLKEIPDGKRILLVTAHRRENFGTPLQRICEALLQIAIRFRGSVHIVYPVHLNPEVQTPVRSFLKDVPNITLLPPIGYRAFVHLMMRSYVVLTDSGGIQEEAPFLGKPVLVLRGTTERLESVASGNGKLVGVDSGEIVEATTRLLEDPDLYQRMARVSCLYGDGRSSERIVAAVLGFMLGNVSAVKGTIQSLVS